MKNFVKIEVKAIDIKKGMKEDCKYCPVARAIKRRYPKARGVFVRGYIVEWRDYCYALPLKVQNFIERFDDGLKVRPFSFFMKRP